ncbi:MAG TPA: TIGR00730 family Rossman fold protein [Streptosporangiaceae bacterium]
MLSSVGVYCGSSRGADPGFAAAAESLGRTLAERGVRLVYGGGHVGLMGVVADAVLAGGGEVHGVITRALEAKEVAHRGLTSLEVVETMHERKAAMADKADGFIMLPGGFGTLDEFFEVVTWTQLGIHAKPCGVLDVGGYFGPLRDLLEGATRQRFILPEHRDMVAMESDPGRMLDRLSTWEPVFVPKWLDRTER